jgi:hypothetical protein
MLIGPPSETPTIAARSEPAASITARTSSMRVSMSAIPATRSDRPVPRLSKTIRRQKEAIRSKNSRCTPPASNARSTFEIPGGIQTTSNGPSPAMRYAMLTSPLWAYRVSEISTG